MTGSEAKKERKLNLGYEIFVGVISIISILNIVLNIVYRYLSADADVTGVLDIMNGLFTIIFLGDFTYRILTAPSKREYFFRDFGWADLLASVPFEQGFLKILRVFRLYRVYRLMKNVGPKKIINTLTKDRAGSALYVLLLMGILVLEFGALGILKAEQANPDANIKNASDAVWYVIVTISTVGYGDRYPTTNWGRIDGTIIILVGVGIFGTFTGFLANFFLSPAKKEEEETGQTPPAS
jgi:voltage-gated potassium channel